MDEHLQYHRPVLLAETVEGLGAKEGGVYVDATFGGGGHCRQLLQRTANLKVFAFDKDPDAQQKAAQLKDARLQMIQADFRYLRRFLRMYGVSKIDGVMADLGVSSHQIDQGSRGFSTRTEGPLDMRMDQAGEMSAYHVVNEYPEADLVRVLSAYGEIRNAKTLASALVAARINAKLATTADLVEVARRFAPRAKENRYLAQLFQAIRVEVNDEMKGLEEFLAEAADLLNPGGRMAVITYHSLEDRRVKRYMMHGNFEGKATSDMYGNPIKPLQALNGKPILAGEEELTQNPRARSAKLRVAEKL